MKKKASAACVSFVLCLGTGVVAQGADAPQAQPDTVVALNEQTDGKELLMFFEEQDLVTATKRPTSLRKAPAIATVITADEIRNMGARNLLDVLKMVPGFGISITEFGASMIEVRGVRTQLSEKILVMIDGHSLNKNFTGSALYNVAGMLPMENIRQVEVVRGPGSALYGNSAFVATINIITRNAEEIEGLEIKAGGGDSDSFKGNLVGGKAIGDKLTVSGSLDHYQTHGQKLAVAADSLTGTPFSQAPGATNQNFKQTDAFLKVGYGDLSFRSHYMSKHQNFYIGLASALTDDTNKEQLENYWSELAYNLHFTDTLALNVKLSYDYYEQDPNVKLYPNGYVLTIPTVPPTVFTYPNGMIGKPLVKNRTIGGELQVDWDAFAGNHLIAGISFEEMRQYDVQQLANFNPLTFASLSSVQEVANWNKDATRQIFAAYLQDEWQLLEQVNLTAGLRYDHYSDFGDTLNPRIGLVWNVLESVDLKLLYGQAFRAPNFQELYNINNPVVVGNPHLKPEKIQTYEAGVAWRLNRYFATNLNYFFSTINDQIGWVPSTVAGQPAVNANIGKTETQGVELGFNGAVGTDLYWKLNYTYQDPRDISNDRRLPYVPSHRASGSVNYALTRYLNLHTDLLWTGPRPRDTGDTRSEMPAYTTVDLSATLKNFYKTLEIQATVRNLFDQRYSDPDTSGAAAKVPGDYPREGISGFVTASYKF
ncbi:iron complex outermembrane recepter protein [Trichlorobacter thiogenes]|uniref:Iron complex outermembrane recepter protein n=1 Tax=Trichlorobacter thiogenes TaxID=115783 RepID=A0A1T4PIZ8_9BACT|nr:TonB-dependent receptor [Trichlorobacter thiogenes]SJZ91432.1 iron complex outermembrane recepter protein [Trichlorobacter thiogenes]